jgi:hydrogenase-4 component F
MTVVFVGMGASILPIVLGHPPKSAGQSGMRDGFFSSAPIVACIAVVLMLGIYVPPPLESLLRDAAAYLEVTR